MVDKQLYARAVEALDTQLLPSREVRQFYAGMGNGDGCPLCSKPVGSAEMCAYVEHPERSFVMHIPCFRAWQSALSESARRAETRKSSS